VWNNNSSLTAGTRGPILLEDYHLVEKLANFDRERIPERVVHARGASAKGFFEVRGPAQGCSNTAVGWFCLKLENHVPADWACIGWTGDHSLSCSPLMSAWCMRQPKGLFEVGGGAGAAALTCVLATKARLLRFVVRACVVAPGARALTHWAVQPARLVANPLVPTLGGESSNCSGCVLASQLPFLHVCGFF
jgi:hypothetical protein